MYVVRTTVSCLCGKNHSPVYETDKKSDIEVLERYLVREAVNWKRVHESKCLGYRRLNKIRGIV